MMMLDLEGVPQKELQFGTSPLLTKAGISRTMDLGQENTFEATLEP